VLERYELSPAGARPEKVRRRGITISPAQGARVVLRRRETVDTPLTAAATPLPTAA
jgi:hypothetical protein